MSTPTSEPGRVTAPADDPGVMAAVVVGAAVADIQLAIAARVGMTGSEPLAAILARLDQVLADRPEPPPDGAELVDREALAELREEAAAGRSSRVREVLTSAINAGRMRPADRAKWERLLSMDFDTTAAMIKALPVVVPMSPRGHSEDQDHDEAADLLRDLYGGAST
jgi:hypothetical protein